MLVAPFAYFLIRSLRLVRTLMPWDLAGLSNAVTRAGRHRLEELFGNGEPKTPNLNTPVNVMEDMQELVIRTVGVSFTCVYGCAVLLLFGLGFEGMGASSELVHWVTFLWVTKDRAVSAGYVSFLLNNAQQVDDSRNRLVDAEERRWCSALFVAVPVCSAVHWLMFGGSMPAVSFLWIVLVWVLSKCVKVGFRRAMHPPLLSRFRDSSGMFRLQWRTPRDALQICVLAQILCAVHVIVYGHLGQPISAWNTGIRWCFFLVWVVTSVAAVEQSKAIDCEWLVPMQRVLAAGTASRDSLP
jgi:hypothetical protein